MRIEDLQPEIRELWELYASGQITLESAAARADILEPMLQERLTKGSKGRQC